ncbi:hypothetical protein RND81_01G122900 [Saponaria officinalis]|uniref:(S)-ureidoglycine aminohydrolase cupin domain-containing protein n=1 Tax=Saponaria officinalis TaxID=3572 RepID=A0AAW1NEZ7_SAPOF
MAEKEKNKSKECIEDLSIIVEKCISETRLSELGVKSWPKWGCSPGKYKLRYEAKETCYIVKGKVRTFLHKEVDECVEFGAGDLVIIPKGLSCTWDVLIAVDKFYKFDHSSSSSTSYNDSV